MTMAAWLKKTVTQRKAIKFAVIIAVAKPHELSAPIHVHVHLSTTKGFSVGYIRCHTDVV